jgi:hypothetical protein
MRLSRPDALGEGVIEHGRYGRGLAGLHELFGVSGEAGVNGYCGGEGPDT